MNLYEKTKKQISELLGIPYGKLINMDDDEIRFREKDRKK